MDETKKSVTTKSNTVLRKIVTYSLTIVVGIIVGLLVVTSFNISFGGSNQDDSNQVKIIKLSEVIIAHAPETKQIIFLDRKTGQVQFALSDSVSLAIFALKTAEVVSDYSSAMINKQKQDIKK